ncbi:MAG: UDP-N-acetylmuramate--L-alanine ligase [Ruminococcaceae bacterium]|nr:UDP-N-acetylmuramate--L-alanine ligase [Oscillospiraceae bacterium]
MSEISEVLRNAKKIHFIGIGGSGMCPLAEILHAKGYSLQGSDNNESSIVDRIRNLGIPVMMGQRAENIAGADMIVYSAAIMETNPELKAALESGIPTFQRAELFGEITRQYGNCIGICGTHGKTTTTSMTVQAMITAGLDPSAVIGGKLPLTDSYGRIGNSETIVCEACEYVDTFLHLFPNVSVILNIDEDHMEYFKTMDNLIESFRKFALLAKSAVIYNGDDANTLKAVEGIGDKALISFGFGKQNNYYADNIEEVGGAYTEFDAFFNGTLLGRITLAVPGRHNILNALAAVASCIYSGADFESCKKGIESFRGAGRRFEHLGTYKGIDFIDDYAHHPAELRVTLEAAMKLGYKTVWAVFQPFTYSRTYMHFDEFVDVLKIPDRCVMTEIMGSREVNTYNIYTSQLAEKIPNSVWFNTQEEVCDYVLANAKEGDLVLTMGCGDIYKSANMMIQRLKAE